MASIRKLKGRSKPWQARIRRQGESITQYFRTRREAAEFAAQVEADFGQWSRLLGGELKRHSLADLIDRYMTRWSGKDHNTPCRLAWWRDQFGAWPLSRFDGDAVREGLAALEADPDQPRSGPTINRYRAAISAAYRAGIDGGWFGLRDNPAAGIRARRETHRFGRALGDDERARLLAACDASAIWPGLGVFVRLALATGARRGELLKLGWGNVDLARGLVRFVDTKNGDDRSVPLTDDARARLADWGKVRLFDDERVFPGATPQRSPRIDAAWAAAKAAAGIENLRIHDLRHAAASYLARAGASAFQIAAILGHRSGPGLTARYVHLAAEDSRDLMEAALGSSPPGTTKRLIRKE